MEIFQKVKSGDYKNELSTSQRNKKDRNILKLEELNFSKDKTFRGHRETKLKDYEDRAENSDSSESDREPDSESNIATKRSNKGSNKLNRDNFKELLKL
ncbi:hypothetical protein J6590_075969 [Homalodisca vitripennis]|nr:hypothetical protein J6590_075969 [Homalodisca vitripennis]